MGVSWRAWIAAGNVASPGAVPLTAMITLTTGWAEASFGHARSAAARIRGRMPAKNTTAKASGTAIRRNRESFMFGWAVGSLVSGWGGGGPGFPQVLVDLLLGGVAGLGAQGCVDDRDKEERGRGRDDQAADDGAPERG